MIKQSFIFSVIEVRTPSILYLEKNPLLFLFLEVILVSLEIGLVDEADIYERQKANSCQNVKAIEISVLIDSESEC